jgi:hypothetical protein
MSVDGLLKQVYEISKRYKEIARVMGANFNIFKTLDLQDDELSHSRIIKTLLNPRGDHGQGDTFLKLFLTKILDWELNEDELNGIEVKREYSTDFGRLDIYIYNACFRIIIENKIHADDGCKQIERYAEYLTGKNDNKKNIIVYLTLDGREPSEQSAGKLFTEKKEELLLCKSYKRDILEWLELCQRECHNFSVLHETLTQYINTVKTLTDQTWSKQMEEEILGLMSTSDNIQAALTMGSMFSGLRLQEYLLENNFWQPLKNRIKEHGLSPLPLKDEKHKKIEQGFYGFSFEKNDWNNITIRLEFNTDRGGVFEDFIYGIWGVHNELAACLKNDDAKQTEKHILVKSLDGYRSWKRDGVFPKLVSPQNEVVDVFYEEIKKILNLIETKAQGVEL